MPYRTISYSTQSTFSLPLETLPLGEAPSSRRRSVGFRISTRFGDEGVHGTTLDCSGILGPYPFLMRSLLNDRANSPGLSGEGTVPVSTRYWSITDPILSRITCL